MATTPVFRSLRADDLPELMRLYRELNPNDPQLEDAQAQSTFASILGTPNLLYVGVFLAERLASTCHAVIVPNLTRGARPYALIEGVVTCAEQRRRGYGALAMQGLMQRCWDAGCYKIMLMSGRKRAEIHAFYESLGFDKHKKQAFVVTRP